MLDDDQKAAFDAICGKINEFILFTYGAKDEAALKPIADMISDIHADLLAEAGKLDDRGGAVRLLADTFGMLRDKVLRFANGAA